MGEEVLVDSLAGKLKGHFAAREKILAEVMTFAVVRGSLRSIPPSGYHKVYNIYARKVVRGYNLLMEVDTEPT